MEPPEINEEFLPPAFEGSSGFNSQSFTMVPPEINVEFYPTAFKGSSGFSIDALTPPDRGRRKRCVSDPFSVASVDSGYGTNRTFTPEPYDMNEIVAEMKSCDEVVSAESIPDAVDNNHFDVAESMRWTASTSCQKPDDTSYDYDTHQTTSAVISSTRSNAVCIYLPSTSPPSNAQDQTKPDVSEGSMEGSSPSQYHPHIRQEPSGDSESLIYDTATPGSAYSVASDSSATDDLSSDADAVCSRSAWSGTPDSDEQDSLIFPILEPARRELIERVMIDFRSMMDQNHGIRSRASSTGSHQSGESNTGGLTGGRSETGKRKHKLEGGEDPGPPNDGHGEGANKRPRASEKMNAETSRFACPFFKRNSRKHRKYRSCAGPGWDTVHRVKEHLYRRHALPIQCARCCRPFKSESELKQHHRAPQSCEIQDEEPPEGFDKEQEKLLKSRKKTQQDQGEEGKWKEVYRILFPDEEESFMPSPYYENDEALGDAHWERRRSNEFAQYEEFLSRELPQRVRRELEIVVSRASGTLEDQLKGQLVEIVRNCQAQLFRSYQQSRLIGASPGNGDGSSTRPQESQRASANAALLPGVTEHDLASFFVPPSLYENDIQPSLDPPSGNPTHDPPRHRSHDVDSGYGSHRISFSQNQGSTPIRDDSEYKEQPLVPSPITMNVGQYDRHGIHYDVSDALWRDFPSEDFWRDLSPDHLLIEVPGLEVFNAVEVEGISVEERGN